MAPLKSGTKLQPQKLRRNERERKRVNQINLGFDKLRERVPKVAANKKLSKADTIREATKYIQYLQTLLNGNEGVYAPSTSSPGSNSSMIGDCTTSHMDMQMDMVPVENQQYQYQNWQQDCFYQTSPVSVSSHSSYSPPQHQQPTYICYQQQVSMPSH